ncbi:MAG: 3'-5' exonuclease [Myxococcales bacterium]|nr:3'-5' exonuclease [Myxococcales bacterium]
MPNWTDINIVAIDVETTGFDPQRDRVIEIGMVEMRGGEVIDRWGQLINPGMPIPRAVRELTGIEQDHVEDKPPFSEFAAEVRSRLEGRCVVAYNLSFDRSFVEAELERCGLTWPEEHKLDPLIFARALMPNLKKKRLGDVAAALGVDLREAHRAMDDAEAAGRVLYAWGDRLPADLDDLLTLQAQWERQQEETHAIRRGRGLSLSMGGDALDEGPIELGPAYIYGDEVDPYRALVRALPDARTKFRPDEEASA